MTAPHFCVEHKQPFFKKGKMKGYAHPINDEEGEPTGEWCNEPEDKKEPTKTNGEMTTDMWSEKDRITRRSIERQSSAKIAFEHTKFDVPKTLEIAELIYQWISGQGTKPRPSPQPTESKSTPLKEETGGNLPTTSKETADTIVDTAEPTEWYTESLKKIKWSETTVKSYLGNKYQVDKSGSIFDVIGRLNQEEEAEFVREIKDRLEML